jgi:hypothetical protein
MTLPLATLQLVQPQRRHLPFLRSLLHAGRLRRCHHNHRPMHDNHLRCRELLPHLLRRMQRYRPLGSRKMTNMTLSDTLPLALLPLAGQYLRTKDGRKICTHRRRQDLLCHRLMIASLHHHPAKRQLLVPVGRRLDSLLISVGQQLLQGDL